MTGLNTQQSQVATNQFLQLIGLQQSDLQHQDEFSLNTLGVFLNSYLQMWSLINQMGQFNTGSQKSSTDQSPGILGGGGSGSSGAALTKAGLIAAGF